MINGLLKLSQVKSISNVQSRACSLFLFSEVFYSVSQECGKEIEYRLQFHDANKAPGVGKGYLCAKSCSFKKQSVSASWASRTKQRCLREKRVHSSLGDC